MLRKSLVVPLMAIGGVLALSSIGVVRAEHVQPDKKKTVFSCSSGTACLAGESTGSGTYGVYGTGTADDGGHFTTSSTSSVSGVSGIASASSGTAHGVYGRSTAGIGTEGETESTDTGSGIAGVFGTSSASTNGAIGVYGKSSGSGIVAESSDASASYYALTAQGDSSNTYLFYAYNTASGGFCQIDYDGDLVCSGDLIGGAPAKVRQRSTQGHRVITYAPQASTPTIEDAGTARTYDGIANVELPRDFASVMDRGETYYVFLTPDGDTRGLYVSVKTGAAFQVREVEHGRSNIAFDYRIVAHPLGASNDRLPAAPRLHRPHRAV